MIDFTLDRARSSRYVYAARIWRAAAGWPPPSQIGTAMFLTPNISPIFVAATAANLASGAA
jgi:hypothetical protein